MSTKTATIDPERQILGEVEVIGRDRWEEIRRRAGEGASIRAIARALDLDRKTVRRCLRQTSGSVRVGGMVGARDTSAVCRRRSASPRSTARR